MKTDSMHVRSCSSTSVTTTKIENIHRWATSPQQNSEPNKPPRIKTQHCPEKWSTSAFVQTTEIGDHPLPRPALGADRFDQ